MAFAGAVAYSRYLGRWVAVRCYSGRVYRGVLHEARPDGLVLYQPGGVWASAPGQNRPNLVYADGSLRPDRPIPVKEYPGVPRRQGRPAKGAWGPTPCFVWTQSPHSFLADFSLFPPS
ncbi:hypothetical protein [Kyrpidia sp.]|uniref:hypothetical protein n=1 Tax=Kyrpidia sp. TaxID=2073077 RepID=UPI002590ABEE|nr:hypothetical protein [Kyrpidia sp.]MCL6577038.1 hypothetical protein [Kyrpidia sp.]